MSIAAREWALGQDLGPTHKLVLVVLGDAANPGHACWLKIATIAQRVGISRRTVQRSLQYLVQRELITTEPRHRKDGACTSNLYTLKVEGCVELTRGGDNVTGGWCHPCHRGGVTGDTPLTENLTEIEPPPRKQGTKPEVSRLPDRGGGDEKKEHPELSYPEALLPAERDRAAVLVRSLDPPLQQQVLDEWAGIIAAGDIRKSSLGCLRALVRHAREGSFTLERGIRVAQGRRTRQRVAAQAEQVPELVEVDESDPLVHRILEIRQRSQEP